MVTVQMPKMSTLRGRVIGFRKLETGAIVATIQTGDGRRLKAFRARSDGSYSFLGWK